MASGRKSVGLGEPGRRIGAAWAFAWRSVRASGRPAWGKPSGGVCATEERGRTVPQERLKQRNSHLTALGARLRRTPGAVGTRAGKARLRDTAAPTKLFALKRKATKTGYSTANTTNLGRTITKSG